MIFEQVSGLHIFRIFDFPLYEKSHFPMVQENIFAKIGIIKKQIFLQTQKKLYYEDFFRVVKNICFFNDFNFS